MNRIALLVLACLLAGGAGGCNSFNKDFEAALAEGATYSDITGPWVGTWASAGGHTGELKAIVTKTEDDAYLARYQAKWGWFSKFHQQVVLDEVAGTQEGVRQFIGAADLGFPWGVYHYNAKATPMALNSTYRAEKDEGTYTLRRP